MSDRRVFRWATTSARMLVGTVVAVAFVAAVVTAVAAPWPTLVREPVRIEAIPAPADTVLACTGGLLAVGRDAMSALQLSVAEPQTVTSGVPEGDDEPEETELFVPGASDSHPLVVVAEPQEGQRSEVAASGSAVAGAEDLRGFAASACHPPLMESWLVGGASTTGSSDLVLLSNPGDVPATVQLTVFGTAGAVVPPGGAAVVVAAGTQATIPLAGLALGEESPVIRVTATGAPVRASLQSSLTRTLVPVGVDQVGAVTAPEQAVVIPGVAVTVPPGAEGASDATTLVRILSPTADTSAMVTVTRVGDTEPAIAPSTVPLTAEMPTEIKLAGLPIGQYTVEVTADDAILAAVWQVAGAGEAADFAWYSAAPALGGETLFAVPAGPEAVLTLVNRDADAATVTVSEVDGGTPRTVTVEPGGSGTLRLTARSVYVLDTGGAKDIRSGLSFAGDGALAAFPVWPSDAAARPIVVYP